MKKELEEALDAIELDYHTLVEIAESMYRPVFEPVDTLINSIRDRGNNLSIDQLRDYLLKLQLEAYRLSEIKENAQMRADLSEAKEKDKYAIIFNSLEGSAASKDKIAQAAISNEVVATTLNTLCAAQFKTKVDQLHRMVAVLTSNLMSRMQETKFINMGIADDTNSYKSKQLLTEGNR